MRVGSLFAGLGGWDLGLERAGMSVVWQCESDDFCRRVLADHWPDVPCYEDVRDLSSSAGTPAVDVLCGGFPCQDISSAGLKVGIGGARSGLWSEYARLVGELRPRYVLVENVSALLARGLDVVLGDLAALGYDAEWDCLPASAFGAPHQRDRVWVVAYPNGESEPGDSVDAQPRPRLMVSRGEVPDAYGARLEGRPPGLHESTTQGGRSPSSTLGSATAGRGQSWWAVEPDVGRVADGVPNRMDRLRSLGNALVPAIAEWIGRRIISYEEGGLT